MALEACDHTPSSLPLLFLRSKDDKKMSFCSIPKTSSPINSVKIPDELRDKEISNSYFDWLVLVDKDEQYSLWNPLTSESITFPPLYFRPYQKVNDCLLTSPPGTKGSRLILFERYYPSLFSCKLGSKQWKQHLIREDFIKYKHLLCPVLCGGAIYAVTSSTKKLVKIDLNKLDHLQLVAPELSVFPGSRAMERHERVVESAGELFFVSLSVSGSPWQKSRRKEVIDVEISKLDLSKMELKKVESFKDRAFFIGDHSSFSCPMFGSKIKGDHVYFTLSCGKRVYSYNVDKKTISASTVHSNSRNIKNKPIWIMTDSRYVILSHTYLHFH